MRILLTGAIHWTKEQKDEIKNLGHDIIFIQDEQIPLHKQNINLADIEGVICNGLFLYNDISDFRNLRYIQLTSAGFDRVPMEYIKEHKIEIYNARGVYSIPMAEFALCGVLQFYKQSRLFWENQKLHQWKKNRDLMELEGKTVCIVGCGSVGTECAKRFRIFGCKVIGVDLYPHVDSNYDLMVKLEHLEQILTESDVVILTLPLTAKTKHLMNAERLKYIKSDAVLVNIARGAVIDTDALIHILPKLCGVVLDVFETEPLPDESRLWEMEKVFLTPHNSFVGEGNRQRLQRKIIASLKEKR